MPAIAVIFAPVRIIPTVQQLSTVVVTNVSSVVLVEYVLVPDTLGCQVCATQVYDVFCIITVALELVVVTILLVPVDGFNI